MTVHDRYRKFIRSIFDKYFHVEHHIYFTVHIHLFRKLLYFQRFFICSNPFEKITHLSITVVIHTNIVYATFWTHLPSAMQSEKLLIYVNCEDIESIPSTPESTYSILETYWVSQQSPSTRSIDNFNCTNITEHVYNYWKHTCRMVNARIRICLLLYLRTKV